VRQLHSAPSVKYSSNWHVLRFLAQDDDEQVKIVNLDAATSNTSEECRHFEFVFQRDVANVFELVDGTSEHR
jgi:hypothetical protein